MKKLLALIITVASAIAVIAFAGCGSGNIKKVDINDNESYVFTATSDVMTITDDTTVYDYLIALKNNGEIEIEGSDTGFGYYITSVNGTAEVISSDYSEGTSWAVYLDFKTIEGDDGIYANDYSTCEYKGTTLYYASVGVSSLPCIEGHTYALVFEHWSY